MAQVTMDGREYVELVSKINAVEAENQLFMQTLIMGTFTVDAKEKYYKVRYTCRTDLPDQEEMSKYMDMRIKDVTEKLEQNPLAVQLLYTSGDMFFNPLTGAFASYSWDKNVAIRDMSKKLGEMVETLENGELLVDIEEEEEE